MSNIKCLYLNIYMNIPHDTMRIHYTLWTKHIFDLQSYFEYEIIITQNN